MSDKTQAIKEKLEQLRAKKNSVEADIRFQEKTLREKTEKLEAVRSKLSAYYDNLDDIDIDAEINKLNADIEELENKLNKIGEE